MSEIDCGWTNCQKEGKCRGHQEGVEQMMDKLTRDQAAVIGAYTGVACGPFEDIHGLAEKVLGRPIFTHQFASRLFTEELREAVKPQFLALCVDARPADRIESVLRQDLEGAFSGPAGESNACSPMTAAADQAAHSSSAGNLPKGLEPHGAERRTTMEPGSGNYIARPD